MVSNGDIGATVGDSGAGPAVAAAAAAGKAPYLRAPAANDSAASRSASPSTKDSGWNPSSRSREGKRGVNPSSPRSTPGRSKVSPELRRSRCALLRSARLLPSAKYISSPSPSPRLEPSSAECSAAASCATPPTPPTGAPLTPVNVLSQNAPGSAADARRAPRPSSAPNRLRGSCTTGSSSGSLPPKGCGRPTPPSGSGPGVHRARALGKRARGGGASARSSVAREKARGLSVPNERPHLSRILPQQQSQILT